MAREKTVYECSECGEKHSKWQGKCNGCGNWNCLIETIEIPISKSPNNRFNALNKQSQVVTLNEISAQDVARSITGIGELDRVLGGG